MLIRYSTSSIFKYLSLNWKKYLLHLDKWNFEFIGYSVHIAEFLALVRVLLTYIWRWLAKCLSSSFYSACGDRELKQTRKFFSNKCFRIYFSQPNWRKEVFFWSGRQEWWKVRLTQIAISFNETKKFSPFVKFE